MNRSAMCVGVAVLLGGFGGGAGAADSNAEKEAVLKAQKHLYDAYAACDRKEVERLIVDEPFYRHAVGLVQDGRAAFLNGINPKERCDFDVLRVDPITVHIVGDTAIIFGNLTWKTSKMPAPTDPGKNAAMTVFVKRKSRWLLAANSSMEVPDKYVQKQP
jgi:ketosteroid isomerase-like protein